MEKFMAHKIYGRKVGSTGDATVLMDGDGVSTGGVKVDPAELVEFALSSTRRAVKLLRDKNIEGYVLYDGDPTPYHFTPEADFVYPATITNDGGRYML